MPLARKKNNDHSECFSCLLVNCTLKCEEYSPKMFLLLARKRYSNLTKFLCNFIA